MGRPSAAAPLGHRQRWRLCFWLFYIINTCGYSLPIPYIFHIYIYICPKYFHIYSFVCFVIYSVNNRSGHDQSQSCRSNFTHFGSQTCFLRRFLNDSAWFCVEESRKHGFWAPPRKTMQNHVEISPKTYFRTRNVRNLSKSRDLVMSGPTVDSIK